MNLRILQSWYLIYGGSQWVSVTLDHVLILYQIGNCVLHMLDLVINQQPVIWCSWPTPISLWQIEGTKWKQ